MSSHCQAWRRAIEVNLTAPFHLSQALSPLLSASQIGTIVNITSIYAHLGPDLRLYEGTEMSNPVAYGVSDWLDTVDSFTSDGFIAFDPRVNAIAPGVFFVTKMTRLLGGILTEHRSSGWPQRMTSSGQQFFYAPRCRHT